jgi:radical SAM protein with 4Fe4S-binding SPASM domain
MKAELIETNKGKIFRSENYNFVFDKETGFFARWGKKKEDDPQFSPFGNEIADIEISTICSGVEGIGPCKFCYKNNTKKGINMSLDTFKKVFHNLPKTTLQITFGIGDIESNPDIWNIFDYCRSNGVIPNVTVNGEGITNEIADKLVSKCGAVAVSIYDKDKSYNTVQLLAEKGLSQVNIHQVIHESNFEFVKSVISDIKTDSRLTKLNAIVFLSLKPKGRGKNVSLFRPLNQENFNELIAYAENMGVAHGMDSCTAGSYVKTIENHPNKESLMQMVEGCESTKFSIFIDVHGHFYPCSFMQGEIVENGGDWTEGLDVVNCSNFIKDIWFHEKTKQFRKKCIECTSINGGCPHYKIR